MEQTWLKNSIEKLSNGQGNNPEQTTEMFQKFLEATIDSLSQHIAVLDSNATIVLVNKAWKIFADLNGLCSPNYCVGDNYIEICRKASQYRKNAIELKTLQSKNNNVEEQNKDSENIKPEDNVFKDECIEIGIWDINGAFIIEKTEGVDESLEAITKMLDGEIDSFSIDYPCHSPNEQRWFRMNITRFTFEKNVWLVVSHENITKVKLTEINLIQTENKLNGIIQSIPDAMCMIDRNQNIVWANDVAKELYSSSLIGEKCYRAYGRWNNLCQNCIVHKTFIDGKVHSGEYIHWDIYGNERIILCTSSVSGCDEAGNIIYVMEIMRDITEKKLQERTLKFMQFAVDTTEDGVYWIDPDGSIKYVNQSVLKYTGYTEEEITKLKVHNIDPNIKESSWGDVWRELRQTKSMRFETKHRTKNGVEIPFEVTANHVIFDKGEECNFAVVRNISERKKNEREIKRLYQAIEYSPVSVVITDINGNIEYVNHKFSQVTGYSKEEALGQNPRILNAGRMKKSYYKKLWDTILSGKEWKGEFINKKKNGELYWESASISPVVSENGKTSYFVAIKEDITERKKMVEELKLARKKAESATRAKSEFLATMSHEIRTPMNAIIGISHLMIDTPLSDVQYGYLSNIQSAANSLLSIINDILDISKIEAGKMEFEYVEFEWNEIIEKIFNVLKFTANEKQLELIYSFGKGIPKVMIGDPTRLSQVIMNLVGNAVKYTPSGEVVVHAEVVSEEEKLILESKKGFEEQNEASVASKKASIETSVKRGGAITALAIREDVKDRENKLGEINKTITLKVSIKDTGIGISESKLASLFTPFTQADSSTTRKFGGTGLGLVIAKRIVNKMGGDIRVESTPGRGSTFTFTVVLNKKADAKINNDKIGQTNTYTEEINAFSNLNVMVIEPHASSRRAITTMLKSLNIRAIAVSNGDEAIQLMELTCNPNNIRNQNRRAEKSNYRDSSYDLVMINSDIPSETFNCEETIKQLKTIGIKYQNLSLKSDSDISNMQKSDSRNLAYSNNINSQMKFIVMHNFASNEQAGKIAQKVRISDFLPKPITPNLLIKTIFRVINAKEELGSNGKIISNKLLSVEQQTTLKTRPNILSAATIQEQYKFDPIKLKYKHILVVDDDELNRHIVIALLRKLGIENISEAINGNQAVEKTIEMFSIGKNESSEMDNSTFSSDKETIALSKNITYTETTNGTANKISNLRYKPFDLILMDIEMPVMDGLEATRRIRELGITVNNDNGESIAVPIVALTGHALDEYREKCFKAGMSSHIEKPIQPEKLFATLQKYLL